MKAFSRKKWIWIVLCGGLAYAAADALLVEPHWIKITHLRLSDHASMRVVHISDFHYEGDLNYLTRIVTKINQLSPDVVCFTGDIVEDPRFLDQALTGLAKINAPLYGVPGNHDYWSGVSFEQICRCFQKNGGEWLEDRSVLAAKNRLLIVGSSGMKNHIHRAAAAFAMPGHGTDWQPVPGESSHLKGQTNTIDLFVTGNGDTPALAVGAKKLLLTHYPASANSLTNETYDLILAGHAHGGQVRLPGLGALILPFGVDQYQRGLYSTPAGPLYVSSGLGTWFLPVRFFCRPEITLIEL